ncbi:MAG: arylesterase [Rhodocyclaceae bacterium]|nr:arylesterase [Rhodocyclaceae bacterium]
MPLLQSIVSICLVLVVGIGHAADILVWGDSLSAGYRLRADQSWPSLLQSRLEAEGFDGRVVNGSVSGETTAGGRSRLRPALERHRPDVLILALGANDGLRGLPPLLMRDNLAGMIDAAHAAGARVLLVGMRLPPNYGPVYAAKFRDSFSAVADDRHVALLPFLLEPIALDPGAFLEDGLHPTAEAQPAILDHVWRALRPLLDRRS